jgi:hypothetical protein
MMSNDSTFTDGTVPVDADLGPDVADTEHVAPDGQTTGDGEQRLDEGMVQSDATDALPGGAPASGDATAESRDEIGLEHGLGSP